MQECLQHLPIFLLKDMLKAHFLSTRSTKAMCGHMQLAFQIQCSGGLITCMQEEGLFTHLALIL